MSMPKHLKPGIKTGPDLDDSRRLAESGAMYTEVWYRIDWPEKYTDLFNYIHEHGIHTGLHFWGTLEHGIMPNLAYPDPQIWKPSLKLMQENLDVAAQNNFYYVNIHLGNSALNQLNLEHHWTRSLPETAVETARAEETFEQNIITLNDYAKNAGVKLLIETVPGKDPHDWDSPAGRLETHDAYALSNHFLERIARDHNLAINHDLAHTSAELITSNMDELWTYMQSRTKALAPFMGLSHFNTMSEPFNGTDSHDGITDEDFSQNVFPSKLQLLQLLQILNDAANAKNSDIWIVSEPRDRHVENYRALCNLLATIA